MIFSDIFRVIFSNKLHNTFWAAFSFPSESLLVPIGFMGAPTVLIEKLVNGRECYSAIKKLEEILQVGI
jgi:DUF917 family protein